MRPWVGLSPAGWDRVNGASSDADGVGSDGFRSCGIGSDWIGSDEIGLDHIRLGQIRLGQNKSNKQTNKLTIAVQRYCNNHWLV
jgi:hypothetical protein